MIDISDIARRFRATPASLDMKDNLIRNQGWTTNGYWLLRSALEPAYLRQLKENGKTPDIEKAIAFWTKQDLEPMILENHFKLQGAVVMVRMQSEKHETWLNACYLSMFNDTKLYGFTFSQNDALCPLIIKHSEEIVGTIMPIRCRA